MWSLKRLSVSDVSSGVVAERTTSPSRRHPRHYRKNHRWSVGVEWSEETGFKFGRDHIMYVDPGACIHLYGEIKRRSLLN